MSIEHVTWALKQHVPHSPAKFVLVVLANQANHQNESYPSVAYLTETTGQDRKTVLANLKRLIGWGFIEDTGARVGRTRQIIVYRLEAEPDLFTDNAPKGGKNGTGTKSGTVPKVEQSQIAPETVPISTCNSPKSGTRNLQEPTGTSALPAGAPARDAENGADPPAEPPAPENHDFGPVTVHPGPVALLAMAMIEAGMPAIRVSPSHPLLAEACTAGVTPDEVRDLVRELMARGTGPPALAYVLRTALGRRADCAAAETNPTGGLTRANRSTHSTSPRLSAVGRTLEAIKRRRANEAAAGEVPGRPAADGQDG